MATPTSQMQQYQRTIDDLTSRAWYNILRDDPVNQILEITPFYNMMIEKGKIKDRMPDGTHWEVPIKYNKQDQNMLWFGKGSTFSMAEKEENTRLRFEARNLGTNIIRYWDDERKINGQAKLQDYVEDKTSSTMEALQDEIAASLWTNATDNPLQMTALDELISPDPTSGVVGGLDRSVNPHLRNQTADMTSLSFASDSLGVMRKMINDCSNYRGNDKGSDGKNGPSRAGSRPDIIVTTQAIYEAYEDIAENLRRIDSNDAIRANLGFGDLAFKGIEMFYDPGCPAGNMYFLNTGTLELKYDPRFWMTMTDWKPVQGNSLDRNAQVVSVMQLTCDMFRRNGVIHGIDPTS